VSHFESDPAAAAHQRLLNNIHWELIPMKNLEKQKQHVPAGAPVSMTCSPVKGIDETVRLTEEFVQRGHPVTPHFAARMMHSREHLAEALGRIEAAGVTHLFCIAGDGEEPAGPYADSVKLIADVVDMSTSLTHVGFGSYPDGHAFISDADLRTALHEKQAMVQQAGLSGWTSTQMCFDAAKIRSWLEQERAAGLEMPVYLGVAGAVDRTKLMTMGMRLGIGASLSYLKKNKSTMGKLLGAGYDANQLIAELAGDADRLNITAVHGFTFNQVESTVQWLNASR